MTSPHLLVVRLTENLRAVLRTFAILFALVWSAGGAQAQFNTPFVGNNDEPIAISADGDIEWNRSGKYYMARGKAQASQGDVFIQAETLQAFYREDQPAAGAAPASTGQNGLNDLGQGSTTIFRLLAEGDVYIKSGSDVLVGEKLEYLIEEERATVTGNLIILATAQGSVSARASIVYDSKQLFAIAEGNAQVVQENNIVGAERLTAYFYPQNQQQTAAGSSGNVGGLDLGGGGRIRLVEAQGKVELTDGTSYAVADFARYDPNAQKAILRCRVKVTQGNNQLAGDYAEYDFGTGEARVQSRAIEGCPSQGDGRTYILIDPKTGAVQQGRQP